MIPRMLATVRRASSNDGRLATSASASSHGGHPGEGWRYYCRLSKGQIGIITVLHESMNLPARLREDLNVD